MSPGPPTARADSPAVATERRRSPPLWIGVTGNIACGKSTVSTMLRQAGVVTIDADEVYAELVTPRSPLLEAIARHFGRSVLMADGSLDRRALAGIVFSDAAALADLDRIVRPPVVAEILRRAAAVGAGPVGIDAVKLFESGLAKRCDEVWVVTCDPETQVARLMARNRLDEASARRRIAAQTPIAEKIRLADRVIANDGSASTTRRLVEQSLTEAKASWRSSASGTVRRASRREGRQR